MLGTCRGRPIGSTVWVLGMGFELGVYNCVSPALNGIRHFEALLVDVCRNHGSLVVGMP